uniref:Secreted Odorant Binding Protein Family protein n=1 Tax=Pristhesancus plagipennis TaxID=1955184 RepID=A0A2K8JSK5_PRIPG|nr:secreted Odorant Binding Protein Family protein [Pristhesancus plagipennis]
MKSLCIIIACVLHCTLAEMSIQKDLKTLSKTELEQYEAETLKKCLKENNVSETVLDDLNMARDPQLPNNREFKCMAGCFCEHMTYIKDNKPQWDNLYDILLIKYGNPGLLVDVVKIINACKKVVPKHDDDICNLGYEIGKCYLKEAERVGPW